MADVGDAVRDRRRRQRVFKKPERESYSTDKMRTPVIQVVRKGGQQPYSLANHCDFPSPFAWEKRGRGHHHTDWEACGSTTNLAHHGEGLKDSHSPGDSGFSSGRGDFRESYGSGEIQGGDYTGDNLKSLKAAPVILSRGRQNDSPSQGTSTPAVVTRKEPEKNLSSGSVAVPATQYQIASKPTAASETSVTPESVMTRSAKLLDDGLNITDDLSSYLLDQNNFLVLAVVGSQGVGKSTIASLLANPSLDLGKPRTFLFRPESLDEMMSGCHRTSGVDMFVTWDRVIVLDFQPLLSPSVMDVIITQDKKFRSDYGSTENLMEIESLQILTFAMSVAHALLVVQDYTIDGNLLRLLQTCEMMKPSSSLSSSSSSGSSASSSSFRGLLSEESHPYFPHVVFVHNHVPPRYFCPVKLKDLQAVYHQSFMGSCLEKESNIGMCNGSFVPSLNSDSCGQMVNLFLIPDMEQQDQCPISFLESICEMRRQIVSLHRGPLTHVTLTEKSWYHYACRMWDNVRRSSLYFDYSQLLP